MSDVSFELANHWFIVRFNTYSLSEQPQIERIGEAVFEQLHKLPLRPHVLLNFKRVEFVSSQVIGLLLEIQTRTQSKHGELVLARVNPKIREAMKILRLDSRFKIVENSLDVVGKVERAKPALPSRLREVAWMD